MQSAWQETVTITLPELVGAYVEDEWSLAQTLRVQQPFHEIGQILAVRAERQQLVTDILATGTPELVVAGGDDPWGGGDGRPSVGECIRVILEEEWVHLRHIRRDLDILRRPG